MLIECESGKTEMDMAQTRAAHIHNPHGKAVRSQTEKPISLCDKITI